MKRIFLFLALLFTAGIVSAQSKYGVSLLGKLNTPNDIRDMRYVNPGMYTVYLDWQHFETAPDVFDYSYIDDKFETITDSGLYVSYIFNVSPWDDNSPAWLNTSFGVPIVTTSGPGAHGDRYPYYLDTNYQKRFYNVLKKLSDHVKGYAEPLRSKIVSGMHGIGSTGDLFGYKGTPDNPAYNITAAQFDAFTFRTWDSLNKYYTGLPSFRIRFNPGNDAEYTNQLTDSCWYKAGILTHDFSFDGEISTLARWEQFKTYPADNRRLMAEVQNVWESPYWQLAKVKNSQYLFFSNLTGGLDVALLPGGWKVQNITDPRPTDFFNKYAGKRNTGLYNAGFIALGNKIDLADTVRFPTAIYGVLINPDPTVKRAYDRRISNINRLTTSEEHKDYERWLAIVDNINPARVTAIRAANPQAMWPTDPADFYHKDYIIGGVKNYGRFVYMVDPVGSSKEVYRVGPDSAIYGRYTREFLIKNGIGEMKFQLDTLLKSGVRRATIKINVTYYNEGSGKFSVNCFKCGKQPAAPALVTKTGTNKWVTQTFTMPNARLGRRVDDVADFSLVYKGGDNTRFALIEVEIQ